MVQKEVKKKTKIYGTVAVLSAIILVTMIYAIGTTPFIYPPNQSPFVSGMKTFSSLDELRNYINNTSQQRSTFSGGPLDSQYFGSPTPIPAPASASLGVTSGNTENSPHYFVAGPSDSYSTTNVQVAGVDEADTVKTDGQYIYTVSTAAQNAVYWNAPNYSSENNSVYIVKSDPQNPQIMSKISLANDTEPAGLFLSQDGNKLVVLASKYQFYSNVYYVSAPTGGVPTPMLPTYNADVYTYINVYDVSNKANPVLTRNLTVSGSYFNSRMIGNNVYVVVSQPAQLYDNAVTLPTVFNGSAVSDIAPTSIYYTDMVQPSYYTFTSFFGINILDDAQAPTNMTVMMGGASTMYVPKTTCT